MVQLWVVPNTMLNALYAFYNSCDPEFWVLLSPCYLCSKGLSNLSPGLQQLGGSQGRMEPEAGKLQRSLPVSADDHCTASPLVIRSRCTNLFWQHLSQRPVWYYTRHSTQELSALLTVSKFSLSKRQPPERGFLTLIFFISYLKMRISVRLLRLKNQIVLEILKHYLTVSG